MFTYDDSGNRSSFKLGATTYPYAVSGISNRLLSTAGPAPARTFSHDNAGNVTGDGQTTFVYDARGRMVSATNGAGTHTYAHNALGERVKKSGPLVHPVPWSAEIFKLIQ